MVVKMNQPLAGEVLLVSGEKRWRGEGKTNPEEKGERVEEMCQTACLDDRRFDFESTRRQDEGEGDPETTVR